MSVDVRRQEAVIERRISCKTSNCSELVVLYILKASVVRPSFC